LLIFSVAKINGKGKRKHWKEKNKLKRMGKKTHRNKCKKTGRYKKN
jgi:hypothetical protein